MEVQSEEDSVWKRSDIRYWNGHYEYDNDNDVNYIHVNGDKIPVNTFLGGDPATDIDTKESDYSVIMVVAVDMESNVYVLHYERHKSIPTIGSKSLTDGEIIGKKGVVDYIMELHQQYHCL